MHRLSIDGDSVRIWFADGFHEFDVVIVTAFAHDAYGLLDRSGLPRLLDHRRHTHCKSFTVDLHPQEPVLADTRGRIAASFGVTTVVQPGTRRCVSMAAYPRSTERDHVLEVIRDQLSLVHPPVRVLERENLRPGEAVFVGDYIDPVALAGSLGPRVQFAGSCMDNSYPVDSAEGAVRSAYQAVERIAAGIPGVGLRPRPCAAVPATRTPLFRFTRRRTHPNAPASSALSRRLWRMGQRFSRTAVGLVATVEFHDRGARPPSGTPAVYVATHRSLFDVPLGVVTFERLGVAPRLVVAAKYFNHPLGSYLRGIGALAAIRRSDATINAAVAAVECGESVAFMVEGRIVERRGAATSKHGRGAVEVAARTGVPIVPIAAGGTDQVWPTHARRPFFRFPRTRVTVVVGEPLDPTGPPWEVSARLRRELHALEEYATTGCTLRQADALENPPR